MSRPCSHARGDSPKNVCFWFCGLSQRQDGNGYPKGLKGEEIPFEARIMAVADVYDALVSKRVYKEEFSFEEANKIILDGMGKQFDPGLEKYYLQAREKIENFYRDNK